MLKQMEKLVEKITFIGYTYIRREWFFTGLEGAYEAGIFGGGSRGHR